MHWDESTNITDLTQWCPVCIFVCMKMNINTCIHIPTRIYVYLWYVSVLSYTHKHRHGHTYTQTNIYSLCVYLHACMSLFIEVVHMPWRGRVCIGLQILVVVLNPRISCILCNRACPVRSRILLDSVICSTYTHTHTNTRTRTHTHTHTHIHPHTHINFETPLNSQEVTQCRLALMVLWVRERKTVWITREILFGLIVQIYDLGVHSRKDSRESRYRYETTWNQSSIWLELFHDCHHFRLKFKCNKCTIKSKVLRISFRLHVWLCPFGSNCPPPPFNCRLLIEILGISIWILIFWFRNRASSKPTRLFLMK